MSSAQQQKQKRQIQLCQKILKDKFVLEYFLKQLLELPSSVYQLTVAFDRIYILFNINRYKQTLTSNQHQAMALHKPSTTEIESLYVLKIAKNFPMNQSVRLNLLQGAFMPKISDCRDLFETVMGKSFDYQIRLVDILEPLASFDQTLHLKNQKFLELQKVGKFILGQTFYYQELVQYFSAVILMKDLSNQKKVNLYVGISETHLLVFKQIIQKNRHSNHLASMHHPHSFVGHKDKGLSDVESQSTPNKLMLISWAELQCITALHYRETQKIVMLTLRKYQSAQPSANQCQDSKKQFKLSQPELFLRRILKHITKFQTCEIELQPFKLKSKIDKRLSLLSSKEQDDVITARLSECLQLQSQLKMEQDQSEKRKKLDRICRYYQKLIDYYSARANPYYLIFVSKLNSVYLRQEANSSNNKRRVQSEYIRINDSSIV